MCDGAKSSKSGKAPAQTSSSSSSPASSSKCGKYSLYVLAAVPILLFTALPIFISTQIAGFTSKYLTNPTRFSLAKIPNMSGKVVIVTGANTGIGFETARRLVLAGAEVIMTSRSKERGDAAMMRIVDEYAATYPEATTVQIKNMICDLSSLRSVRQFVSEFKKLSVPLHLLILNAGVMKSPGSQFVGQNLTYGFELTDDGFEQHIGVNHIAHHYMTTLLTKELVAGRPSRVVSVSSSAHAGGYDDGIRPDTWRPVVKNDGDVPPWYEDGNSYAQSKLANILFARELADRMADKGVTAYSVHPGVIDSDLGRYMTSKFEQDAKQKPFLERLLTNVFGGIFMLSQMTVEDGALTQLYVATADVEELSNGGFYWPVGLLTNTTHPQGENVTLQKYLWKETESAINQALKEEKERRDGV